MNPTVALGESFDALWSGDDTVIDERRACRGDCSGDCRDDEYVTRSLHNASARRADGELVGQLRLPDEFLPVPAGEMFP